MLIGICLVLMLAGGCTPAQQGSDLKVALQKAERERDTLAQQISDEQAKNLALARRVEDTQRQHDAGRAEAANLRAQLDNLTRHNQALEELIAQREKRLSQPLERPAVAASPLPKELDEALQAWAVRFTGRVLYNRDRGAVSFANDRLFDAGSDVVRAEALPAIQDLAGILAIVPDDHEIIVVGHTDAAAISNPDTLAKHPSNWHLSVHRAIAVKDVLVQAGLPAARLGVMGYAQYRPVGDDRAQNRRVEVFIVTKGTVQPLEPVSPTRRP